MFTSLSTNTRLSNSRSNLRSNRLSNPYNPPTLSQTINPKIPPHSPHAPNPTPRLHKNHPPSPTKPSRYPLPSPTLDKNLLFLYRILSQFILSNFNNVDISTFNYVATL